MYCGACGKQLDDRGKFCKNCGADSSIYSPASSSPELSKNLEKSKSSRIIWILALAAVGLWFWWTGSQRSPELITPDLISVEHELINTNYHVRGVTTEAIFDSMELGTPECDLDEGKAEGCFLYEIIEEKSSLDLEQISDEACVLNGMHLHFGLEIVLPYHVNRSALSSAIGRKWDRKVKSISDHEQVHLDLTINALSKLASALSKTYDQYETCSELENEIGEVVELWWSRIDQKHELFDKQELETCEKKTQPHDYRLGVIEYEMDVLTKTMEDYDVLFDEYDRNNDNTSYNLLVPKYNRELDRFNQLFEEYERLADELFWLC